ncbi:3-hydroxyacyl-ACP dehydratase FabZ [Desulfobacterales bacterium HSG16]|nr:3-hydroxyacyl-ACP dehydratase FabZ [Desulfobacterales bacterium HSG16]
MSISYDIKDIMTFLPHRYPFILIDRVMELTSGETIRALKNVTMNEPFFQGHFPGIPIMPGVMIIEAMGQAGGILVLESAPIERRGMPIYFMGMDKVRFRKPVVPGDQLLFEVKILKIRSKAVKMSGTANVDGQCVAEAQLLATFGDIGI